MNPIERLKLDVAQALTEEITFDDEWRKVNNVLDAFADEYEAVTVRGIGGGSLEVGRPNDAGGYDYWIGEQGAKAVPALMLKRKGRPSGTSEVERALLALLHACERGDTTGDEMDAAREALKELEATPCDS